MSCEEFHLVATQMKLLEKKIHPAKNIQNVFFKEKYWLLFELPINERETFFNRNMYFFFYSHFVLVFYSENQSNTYIKSKAKFDVSKIWFSNCSHLCSHWGTSHQYLFFSIVHFKVRNKQKQRVLLLKCNVIYF